MVAFWDIAPCSLFEADWRFRDVYCLHHQGDEFIIIVIVEFYKMETIRFNIKCKIIPVKQRKKSKSAPRSILQS
jgi:hypothetical protein